MEKLVMLVLSLLVLYSCFTAGLTFTNEDGTLTCNSTGMAIHLNYTKLAQYNRPFKVHFKGTKNTSCIIHHDTTTNNINNKTIFLQANFDQCCIGVFERNGNIVYNHTVLVTFGANPTGSQMVFREEEIAFDVECTKLNNITVHLDGAYVNVTNLKKRTFRKSGNTSFGVQLIRTADNTYLVKESSTQLKLGQTMYFKVILDTNRSDLVISPQWCYATNARNSAQKYFLIKNRCPNAQDETVKFSNAINKNSVFLWENKAFRFFGSSDAVYISCDVLICESTNNATACQRCKNGVNRRRRGVVSWEDEQANNLRIMRVSSPLFVIVNEASDDVQNSADKTSDYADIFSGIQGTIIIVLIIALVLIMMFLVSRRVSSLTNSNRRRFLEDKAQIVEIKT